MTSKNEPANGKWIELGQSKFNCPTDRQYFIQALSSPLHGRCASCCNHYSRVFDTESITLWHNTAVLGLGAMDDRMSQSKQK